MEVKSVAKIKQPGERIMILVKLDNYHKKKEKTRNYEEQKQIERNRYLHYYCCSLLFLVLHVYVCIHFIKKQMPTPVGFEPK